MAKVGNNTMQGWGLWTRASNWIGGIVDGGAKEAAEKGKSAAGTIAGADHEDFLRKNPNATQAEIDLNKSQMQRKHMGPVETMEAELKANSVGRKMKTMGKFGLAATVLGATIGPALVSSGMTLWENSQREAGANAWYFGICNFIAITMEKLGLDKKMPGAYKWLVETRDSSRGTVGSLSHNVEQFVPDSLDQGSQLLAATGVGLTGLAAAGATYKYGGSALSYMGGKKAGTAIETAADAVEDVAIRGAAHPGGRGKAGLIATGVVAGGATLAAFFGGSGEAEAATLPKGAIVEKTAENVVMGGMTGLTALETAKGASILLREGAEFGAKRIPVVGFFATAGLSAYSAFNMASEGKFGQAFTEMGTGLVEGVVNGTGLGLVGGGDLAREGLRATFTAVAGEEYAPDKSGLRSIAEWATGTGDFEQKTKVANNGFSYTLG